MAEDDAVARQGTAGRQKAQVTLKMTASGPRVSGSAIIRTQLAGDFEEASMRQSVIRMMMLAFLAGAIVISVGTPAEGKTANPLYPRMAPLGQYLMADRDAEIALARSAAPSSISQSAEVLILGPTGYKTAIQGKNGFVCMVERSWTAPMDDPDFWNPELRAPICFNPPAARTYLPITIMKTNLVLAGKSKAGMFDAIRAAFDNKKLPVLEPGAMCYMMSREGNLGDGNGHWHPHLMFFAPLTKAAAWGANQAGSPILAADDAPDRLTVFLVPVGKWSDGTPDSRDGN